MMMMTTNLTCINTASGSGIIIDSTGKPSFMVFDEPSFSKIINYWLNHQFIEKYDANQTYGNEVIYPYITDSDGRHCLCPNCRKSREIDYRKKEYKKYINGIAEKILGDEYED